MSLRLPDVSCRYGAPMGRRNELPDDCEAPVKLNMVRLRWYDGDYDQGGAYWGNSGGTSIYWATSGTIKIFVRAASRDVAKNKVRHTLPNARFYR
jgi:hypothetical protein